MKIWLDDIREAPDGWVHVKTPGEAIELLRSGEVEEISLDHDLGLVSDDGRELAGYDVLLWIEQQVATESFEPPQMYIHSANAAAWKRMEQAIASIKRLNDGR